MTRRIDARGMRCPWPAIRLGKALREWPDPVVEIVADDPAAERELSAVAKAAGASLSRCGDHCFRVTRRASCQSPVYDL